jgi:hypothetical protein
MSSHLSPDRDNGASSSCGHAWSRYPRHACCTDAFTAARRVSVGIARKSSSESESSASTSDGDSASIAVANPRPSRQSSRLRGDAEVARRSHSRSLGGSDADAPLDGSPPRERLANVRRRRADDDDDDDDDDDAGREQRRERERQRRGAMRHPARDAVPAPRAGSTRRAR